LLNMCIGYTVERLYKITVLAVEVLGGF
jgi:hypothetical protein